jgi:hypothetical protein
MVTRFQRHCSDESLLAHLDGELPFYRQRGVHRHMEKCWQCRLRRAEIEQQILQVTRAAVTDIFPGPERIARARAQFLNRAGGVAAEVFASRQARERTTQVRILAWTAACLAVAIALPAWFVLYRAAPVSAAETLRRVEAAETEAARATVHQRYRVLVRQERPAAVTRENLLEVWSEPERGRFASRFSAGDGSLRLAVWQPRQGARYRYDAARPPEVVATAREEARAQWDALFHDGLTLEEFELCLMTWLRNRPWQPVSVSSDFAVFTGKGGALLTAERVGTSLLRLRARKTVGGATVEFTLEVDWNAYRPRLQSIRYESAARVLEVQFNAEPAGSVTAAAFEPDVTPAIPAGTSRLAPVSHIEPDADAVELQAHFALHHAQACLGEPIAVTRAGGDAIAVTGVVVDSARKNQVIAALAGLRVRLDLRTAGEEIERMELEGLSDRVRGAASPLEPKKPSAAVLSHFDGDQSQAGRFIDQVVSAGEDTMKEAQALRQLAERFGGRSTLAAPGSRELVDRMVRDHVSAMREKLESIRRLMAPLYPDGTLDSPVSPREVTGQWEEVSAQFFPLVRELNTALLGLSTRAATPGTGASELRDIATAFRALEAGIRDRFP